MNYCPHCGAKIDHDGKFCQACGKPLAVESEVKPSFKESFSQLKQLTPNRTNFNRVIGFMHANFFLIHTIYLVIFIIALISPWSGLWALLLGVIGIYLYGALHSSDELDWNKQVKEMLMAVGENRPVDTKKDMMDPVHTAENEAMTADTFDELDVAANVVAEPENPTPPVYTDPQILDPAEGEIEADIETALEEELDELEELNELEQVQNQDTLDELEQIDDTDVIVAPEGEAEILLDDPEEKTE